MINDYILFVPSLILMFLAISKIFWPLVNTSWLRIIVSLIVVSLPFELIPSIDIAGATVKVGYILTFVAVWILIILLIKKDKKLFSLKINRLSWFLLFFLVTSLTSFPFIQDPKRALLTFTAVLITFLASILVANFADNLKYHLRNLAIVLTFTNLFALYQLLGDLIGLSASLTGLRIQYTGIVFGLARPHATALEPLFYSGMLFVSIIALFFGLASKEYIFRFPDHFFEIIRNFLPVKIHFFVNNFYLNLIVLGFHLFIFTVNISKGAYLSLAVALIFGTLLTRKRFDYLPLLKIGIWFSVFLTPVVAYLFFYSEKIRFFITETIQNFIETIQNRSSSASQRSRFVEAFWFLLPGFIITGAGYGQYGNLSNFMLRDLQNNPDSYFVVNNTYLEIWLEQGILSLFVFLLTLFYFFMRSLVKLKSLNNCASHLIGLTLSLSLLAYCIQWLTFSPTYIMPIFILLGLGFKWLETENNSK